MVVCRFGAVLAACLVLICGLTLSASAEETMPDLREPLAEFYAAIPDDLRSSLPDAIFDDDAPDAEAVRAAGGLKALLEHARDALANALPAAGKLFGQICLCTLFAALFSVICTAFDAGPLGEAAQLCGRLCTAAILLEVQMGQLDAVRACLRQLQVILNGMLPVLTALFAAGGSTGTATAGCGSLLIFLNLGENLCAGLFFPLVAAACGLAAVAWMPDGDRLRGIAACIKRVTVWALGLFGAVFSAVLAFQTVLATGADSVAARTVKFAVSSAVPVIGGVVGDTVRTVAAGVGYLKDTVGLLGILLMVLLALPPLLQLLVHRAVLILGEAVAELLGCAGERKLLGEFVSVSGTLLALLCGALLCFVFALVLFVRITLAIGK